jgi:hypothetical protein
MLPNLVTGAVTEIGAFAAAGIASPTSGSFFRYGSNGDLRGVSISVTGAESTTEAIPTPSLNVAHDYTIWIMSKAIVFQIDDVVVGSIPLGNTAPSPVTSESAPFCARLYNASATSTAQQVYLHRCVGALYGGTYGYDRQFLAALGGDIGSQGVVGAGTGYLANWVNSAAPISATLSNTTAGYTSLGGQFQFAAVSGSETDCALFAFQVPAQTPTNQGRTLVVHGINISTFNMGAAVKKRVADYGWKETPIYCYPTSEWAPQYQDLRNNQGIYVKTLTSRIMAIVAVFKKPDGTCGFMNMQIEQQNSYSAPGSLAENYITPPTDYANSGMDPIDCAKANANK